MLKDSLKAVATFLLACLYFLLGCVNGTLCAAIVYFFLLSILVEPEPFTMAFFLALQGLGLWTVCPSLGVVTVLCAILGWIVWSVSAYPMILTASMYLLAGGTFCWALQHFIPYDWQPDI